MVLPDRFFFALFSLFRFSISFGLLERPLVVGICWALVTGQWEVSLAVAIFLELSWLDIIPAGTFIQPHLAAAAFMALSLCTYLGLEQPSQALVAMLAGVPMAWLGTQLESSLRTFNNRAYNITLLWARRADQEPFPTRVLLVALGATFVASWLFFVLFGSALAWLVQMVMPAISNLLSGLEVTWPQLWLAASFGGLLALRLKQALGIFAGGLAAVALVAVLGVV